MYLTALTLGYAIPHGNFSASVHSVFRSALNLLPATGDHLLTLVGTSEPDLPQGIRLDSPKGFSFETFQVAEPAVCRDGILFFADSRFTVQLSYAQRWKCALSRLEVDPTRTDASAAWSLVWAALNKRQKSMGAEIIAEELYHPDKIRVSIVSSKARRAVRDLVTHTRQLDTNNTLAVETLIGLGSGLTPSGDDLLAGFMAGLWCTVRNHNDRAQFIIELGNRIIALSRRTNDISRTYLFHAVHGQVSSRLGALAEAICNTEKPERLLEIAEQAMQNGSTSGMDAVTGLLVGMST